MRSLTAALASAAAVLLVTGCTWFRTPTWQENAPYVTRAAAAVRADFAQGRIDALWNDGADLEKYANDALSGGMPPGHLATLYVEAMQQYSDAGNLLSPGWEWDNPEYAKAQADMDAADKLMTQVNG